jgi:hypothetical protein
MDNELLQASFSDPLSGFRPISKAAFSSQALGGNYSPDVSRLIKFDPAVQRVLRIDINNPSGNTLIRYVDVNRDAHSAAQCNPGSDQCSLKIDDDGLSFTRPSLGTALHGNSHPQGNPSASSRFMKGLWGRHE